jgi:hypothetical protein
MAGSAADPQPNREGLGWDQSDAAPAPRGGGWHGNWRCVTEAARRAQTSGRIPNSRFSWGSAMATGLPGSAEPSPFILGGAAPDAAFLVRLKRELQTRVSDFAVATHGLCGPDRVDSRAGAANGEEQFRARVPASRVVPPSNIDILDSSRVRVLADWHTAPLNVVKHGRCRGSQSGAGEGRLAPPRQSPQMGVHPTVFDRTPSHQLRQRSGTYPPIGGPGKGGTRTSPRLPLTLSCMTRLATSCPPDLHRGSRAFSGALPGRRATRSATRGIRTRTRGKVEESEESVVSGLFTTTPTTSRTRPTV